jgi:hypothetical protein
MDVDIEVQLAKVPKPVALEIAKRFSVEFASKKEKGGPQDIVVRPTSQQPTLEKAIASFLAELVAYGETIKQSAGTLRVGVFYDLDETVVFPMRLSADVIRTLSAMNLALDATGYPCKEDD